MNKYVWIITYEINEYNQEGQYIHRVFQQKPTKNELDDLGYDGELLLSGGGQKSCEYKWYNLTKLKFGEIFKD